MLNSQDRRPAFDAFFRSLPEDARGVFMDDAMSQWYGLQDSADDNVSVIDCMENVWDFWREFRSAPDSAHTDLERAVALVMNDADRIKRETSYRNGTAI